MKFSLIIIIVDRRHVDDWQHVVSTTQKLGRHRSNAIVSFQWCIVDRTLVFHVTTREVCSLNLVKANHSISVPTPNCRWDDFDFSLVIVASLLVQRSYASVSCTRRCLDWLWISFDCSFRFSHINDVKLHDWWHCCDRATEAVCIELEQTKKD